MPDPEKLSQPRKQGSPKRAKQVSIERGGLGQSGYTAGRQEGDTALEDSVDTRYVGPPGSGTDGLGTDDRFTGRGGPVRDVERDAAGATSTEADGASGRDVEDIDDGTAPRTRPVAPDDRGG